MNNYFTPLEDIEHHVTYGNALILIDGHNSATEFHKLCHGIYQNLLPKNDGRGTL